MRWKSMLITIVVNIFVMLAVTMLFEYINLSERFIMLENTVQESLDASIDAAVGSEELFSAQYQAKMSSFGTTTNNASGSKDSNEVRTLIWVDNDEKFYKVNTYLLARFYDLNGRLPINYGEINVLNNYGRTGGYLNSQTGMIFDWLYGKQKTDYNKTEYAWANRSPSRRKEYKAMFEGYRSDGDINANFKAFYDSVGKYQLTAGLLKHKSGDGFELESKTYPTLANMGFKHITDDLPSGYIHDNMVATYHIGKAINSQRRTVYYLTPRSLGVTYIPTEVLKPIFIANLDTLARLNYIGGSSVSGHTGDNLADASHCVATSVYRNGGQDHATHTPSSANEDIVTDGLIEYDLSTVKVKVDYFYINFSSSVTSRSARETVIAKVNGAVQSYNSNNAQWNGDISKGKTLDAFIAENNDTINFISGAYASMLSSDFDNVRNGRIVAKVTVKLKVHVPYQSSMLQWMCEKFGSNNHHYDIKMFDWSTGKAVEDSDGLWYQYSTYYCTSRS